MYQVSQSEAHPRRRAQDEASKQACLDLVNKKLAPADPPHPRIARYRSTAMATYML